MNRLGIFKQLLQQFTRTMHNSSNVILVEKLGNITTIGINRPNKRNCLDFSTSRLLNKAIDEFEQDSNAFVAVLYGTGGNFCSGFDFHELENLENEPEVYNSVQNGLMNLPFHIKKPTIAAVNGYAVAGGLELALLCDLRVMEETAVLGLYSRRFGIPVSDGATVRLQAMIGLSRALDLILTGRTMYAEEALKWGMVNRIVACGTALGQAINLASSLIKFPQNCLNVDRESVYHAAYNQTYEQLIKDEQLNAKKVSVKTIIAGAKKFLSGLGRHGKTYNLTEKNISEWEKEFKILSEIKPKNKL